MRNNQHNNQMDDPRTLVLDPEIVEMAMARGRSLRSEAYWRGVEAIGAFVRQIASALVELATTPKAHRY